MISAAASNPRAASVRIQSDQAARAGGQRKHDLRHAPLPAYVDQGRMHLNSVIKEPLTGPALRKICEDRRAKRTTQRAMKSNASVAMSGIIVFGRDVQADFEALTIAHQDEAYRAVADAVARRLNTTLTGLVAHRDETAPHAHFQLPAYDLDGNALSMTTKRAVTSELQTITADVMKRFVARVERGQGKYERLKAGAEYADTVHRSVAELHHDLRPEIEATEARLAALREDTDKASARVARLNEKEKLLAKEVRRLETYEQRLKTKEGQLAEMEAELVRLQTLSEAQQQQIDQAQRIADEQWDRASAALDAQSAAEARTEALAIEATQIHEQALSAAARAADALLAQVQDDAAKEALRVTQEVSRRLEKTILSEGQQALFDAERQRDASKGAFELLKTVLKEMVPNLYEKVATRWRSLWETHPDNPDRKQEPPKPSYPSGP